MALTTSVLLGYTVWEAFGNETILNDTSSCTHAHAYTLKHFGALLQPKDIQGLVNEVEEELACENATQSAHSARPETMLCSLCLHIQQKGKLESQTQPPETGRLPSCSTHFEFTEAP